MYLVGLTGGIASGKSVVAERLVEHGAELIDADAIAREQSLPGTSTWHKLVEHFGKGILDDEGFIERPKLAELVFNAPDKRTLLNELTHPPVIQEIADQLELLAAYDGLVVLDVPLLVEAGVEGGYNDVVVVASYPETQLDRLVRIRGLSEEQAWARIGAQAPLDDKLKVATEVVWNEGTLDELLRAVDELAARLLARAREKSERESRELPDH